MLWFGISNLFHQDHTHKKCTSDEFLVNYGRERDRVEQQRWIIIPIMMQIWLENAAALWIYTISILPRSKHLILLKVMIDANDLIKPEAFQYWVNQPMSQKKSLYSIHFVNCCFIEQPYFKNFCQSLAVGQRKFQLGHVN